MSVAVDLTRCQSDGQCAFRFRGEEALAYDSPPDSSLQEVKGRNDQ